MDQAARLLGASQARLRELGIQVKAEAVWMVERMETAVGNALGEERMVALVAEGEEMGWEAALSHASSVLPTDLQDLLSGS